VGGRGGGGGAPAAAAPEKFRGPVVPGTFIYLFFNIRETSVQHQDTDRIFHTPGIYYRPTNLKRMACVLGNSEIRKVYNNFELNNLNSNNHDRTHMLYVQYLKYNRFLPPDECNYFAHMTTNILPDAPGVTTLQKGAVNLFPLDLSSEDLNKASSSALGLFIIIISYIIIYSLQICIFLGVVTQSPLRLELEFEPVPTNTWFLMQTFIYSNQITFTGQKTKQDVVYDHLK
jgi:hypothetical protein